MNNLSHKSLTTLATLSLAFFLGRASKLYQFTPEVNSTNYFSNTYQSDSFEIQSFDNYKPSKLSDTTKVYRCGQSKIYYPTTGHNSFKRCKSKVYKLSMKRAKELGMRHCKCNG